MQLLQLLSNGDRLREKSLHWELANTNLISRYGNHRANLYSGGNFWPNRNYQVRELRAIQAFNAQPETDGLYKFCTASKA
jgi:hypothetical protein